MVGVTEYQFKFKLILSRKSYLDTVFICYKTKMTDFRLELSYEIFSLAKMVQSGRF